MSDWLSTAELAALALPGLPATQRGWNEYAEREGWIERSAAAVASGGKKAAKARQRKARGGGFEYHVSLLPPEVLALYAARKIGAVALADADASRA